MTQSVCPFDIPAAVFNASYLATVVSVQDPDNLSRVRVALHNFAGLADQDAAVWARVAAPFAGDGRGAFMLPDVEDEVLVSFVNGDPRYPIVVGGLWNGAAGAPETLGGSGDRVDRWTIVGKAGTRIAIIEESGSQAKIILETPGGVVCEISDQGGGLTEFTVAGTTVTFDTQGVTVQTSGNVDVQASKVSVSAGMVTVDAAMSKFSGVVKCDVLQATTVISSTYTPGAGNVW